MSEKPFMYPVDDFQVQVRFSEGANPLPVEVRLVYGFRLDETRFRTVTYRIPVLEGDLFVEEGQTLVHGNANAVSTSAVGYKIKRSPSGKQILISPVKGESQTATQGTPPRSRSMSVSYSESSDGGTVSQSETRTSGNA